MNLPFVVRFCSFVIGSVAFLSIGQNPHFRVLPRWLSLGKPLIVTEAAIAALGSAVAYITKTLSGLAWWKILIGMGAAVLAVMLPTVIVAFLKLRKRDLSAIMEGSGWGINARMWLTRKQSWYFTQRPGYPKGAKGTRGKFCRLVLITIILAAAVAIVAGLLRDRL